MTENKHIEQSSATEGSIKFARAESVNIKNNDVDQPPVKQIYLVAWILLAAIVLAVLMFVFKPVAEKKAVEKIPPVVNVIHIQYESLSIPVFSQASVVASQEIQLVAELSGRIVKISDSVLTGGVFEAGDLLFEIDDTDYRLSSVRAEANLAAAQQQLEKIKLEAEQAKFDLQQIGRDPSRSTPYALKKPQVVEAQANLKAAKAELEMARIQVNRTKLRAPFKGRVRSQQVNKGQYVSPGKQLAEIYASEQLEVRLPVSLQQLKLTGLSLQNNIEDNQKVNIHLRLDYGSDAMQWTAQLSHLEAVLETSSRLLYMVAKINQVPVGSITKQPLTLVPGMFVKAKIEGLPISSVVRMPRQALREKNTLWIFDESGQLSIKPVEIYAKDENHVYIKSGLMPEDKVIVSALDYAVEGMQLTISGSASNMSQDAL